MLNQYAKSQHASSITDPPGFVLLLMLTPIALYLDLIVFQNGVGEISVTEMLQELFILDCALIFAVSAKRNVSSRGLYILVSFFFVCVLIRELDHFFDLIWHGFWLIPALTVALSAIGYSLLRHNSTIWRPIRDFIRLDEFRPLLLGLIIVMVLSRILGSGHLIWEPLLGQQGFAVKTIIQEGLELIGYTFIVHGSYWHLQRVKNK
ncbi:hypothetical protein [Vibrio ziniensis]|uniref:Uncharacterized protein n=1 Tax=Vibrio ziniensis TaxID=2711221 RepID=A0A6G7CEX2_9VIBR|nr:hypothetical protein [Vibrio ziniensis]QIH40596.1 hypothetical protein G5S32_00790 [Vibrio ziniensis]